MKALNKNQINIKYNIKINLISRVSSISRLRWQRRYKWTKMVRKVQASLLNTNSSQCWPI